MFFRYECVQLLFLIWRELPPSKQRNGDEESAIAVTWRGKASFRATARYRSIPDGAGHVDPRRGSGQDTGKTSSNVVGWVAGEVQGQYCPPPSGRTFKLSAKAAAAMAKHRSVFAIFPRNSVTRVTLAPCESVTRVTQLPSASSLVCRRALGSRPLSCFWHVLRTPTLLCTCRATSDTYE